MANHYHKPAHVANMNGAKVTERNGTLFIALPTEAQTAIAGGCQCAFCRAHPTKTPMWDTLAVGHDAPRAWVVHYPELPR